MKFTYDFVSARLETWDANSISYGVQNIWHNEHFDRLHMALIRREEAHIFRCDLTEGEILSCFGYYRQDAHKGKKG